MSADETKKEFERRLSQLISKYAGQLRPGDVASLLRDYAEEMSRATGEYEAASAPPPSSAPSAPPSTAAGEAGPTTESRQTSGSRRAEYRASERRIIITAPSPQLLADRIDSVVSDRGLMIEVDGSPPQLESLAVAFDIAGVEVDRETFTGRIVHQGAKGAAIELQKSPPEDLRQRLESLVDRARQAAEPEPASTPAPSQSSAAHSQAGHKRSEVSHPNPAHVSSVAHSASSMGSASSVSPTHSAAGAEPSAAGFHRLSSSTYERPDTRPSVTTSQLDALGRPAKTWALDETPVAEILAFAANSDGIGICQVRTSQRRWDMILKDGQLFEVIENPPRGDKSLAALLVRSGRITQKQLEAARERADRLETTLPESLRDLQALSYQKLILAMKSHVVILLRDVLKADAGKASWTPLEHLPRAYFHPPVVLIQRLFEHIYDRVSNFSDARLEMLRERMKGQRMQRKSDEAFPWGVLELEGRQKRLAMKVLEKSRSVDNVLRSSPLNESRTMGVMVALDRLGALNYHGFDEATRTRERTTEDIALLHAQATTDNLFEVLGLHWTTYPDEIEKSYRELNERIEKLEAIEGLNAEQRRKLDTVRKRIDDAYETLQDKRERKKYRKANHDDFEYKSAVQAYENQLEMLTLQHKGDEVGDRCERILELRPNHRKAKKLLRSTKAAQSKKKKK